MSHETVLRTSAVEYLETRGLLWATGFFIPDAVKPAHLWVECKALFVFWRVLLLNI